MRLQIGLAMCDESGPATDLLEYTLFTAPINLMAVKNRAPRKLRVVAGSGTVSAKLTSSGNVVRVLTMGIGDEEVAEFTSIESVTGITNLRVSW